MSVSAKKTYFSFVRQRYVYFIFLAIVYILSREATQYFGGDAGEPMTLCAAFGFGVGIVFFGAYIRFRKYKKCSK